MQSGAQRHGHAAQREHQRGKLAQAKRLTSIAAAASTPMTGTSKVPIEAVAAGSRSSAANQHT